MASFEQHASSVVGRTLSRLGQKFLGPLAWGGKGEDGPAVPKGRHAHMGQVDGFPGEFLRVLAAPGVR